MTKFLNQRCSLRVVGGQLFLRGFETRAYKRKGPGPNTAFNRLRAAIETRIQTALEQVKENVVAKLAELRMEALETCIGNRRVLLLDDYTSAVPFGGMI